MHQFSGELIRFINRMPSFYHLEQVCRFYLQSWHWFCGCSVCVVSTNSPNCDLHKQQYHASHTLKPFTTTNAIKDATLWHVALCMKMSTWVPLISQQGLVPFLLGLVFVFSLYLPAMCASLPCWVDNLSCLRRSHLLSVAGPLGFFTKATGITVPREGNDSLFKRATVLRWGLV